MEDHLQTKWFFNRGLDAKIHLEYPQHLQGEINYYLNKEVLDLPVFSVLNDNFLKQLGHGITTQFAGRLSMSAVVLRSNRLLHTQDPMRASSTNTIPSRQSSTYRAVPWRSWWTRTWWWQY